MVIYLQPPKSDRQLLRFANSACAARHNLHEHIAMIEIRHLKTLIALRESGSLVEAAERLFLTQSALSHQPCISKQMTPPTIHHRSSRHAASLTTG